MTGSGGQLEPIDLRHWPTCENALSWSSEDLAVATGEVVQILTPVDGNSSQELTNGQQWHKFTLPVNQFETSEWPFVDMSTIKHLSIGEELSDSTVVSLECSPPGLGVHRRSVLAILTSNLILSIWETDGISGIWKRTGIVNQFSSIGEDLEDSRESARRRRIRAFCWLPPLKLSASSNWGDHVLAVADDLNRITLWRISKSKSANLGHWRFELIGQHDMKCMSLDPAMRGQLRSILWQSSPVVKLEASECLRDNGEHAFSQKQTCTLKVIWAHGRPPTMLSLRLRKGDRGKADDPLSSNGIELFITECEEPSKSSRDDQPSESDFATALRKPRADFDAKFSLGGRIRTRFHGIALSPDKSQAAACVSFHPVDMIEAVIPAHQHTLIVFTTIREKAKVVNSMKDDSAVHEEILTFVAATDPDLILSDLDRSIARNAVALIHKDFQSSQFLMDWADSMSQQFSNLRFPVASTNEGGVGKGNSNQNKMDLDKGVPNATESGHGNAALTSATPEQCEICDGPIPFSALTPVKCINGHQFSRCNISFLAIQEPGISKYCAKCGRQFLDVGKLKVPDGPSLSQALFDKFDVCPYCQGKFRG
ncbi:hypothetical protein LTS15_009342 [Exophiala xenobiotica]|nr:hypothetical protein LTS15_009342 [Exophiala xenobiotica]